MGLVLSIDLACKKARDFGICLIEEGHGRPMCASFLKAGELKLEDPPDAKQCAQSILAFCKQHGIKVVFLDGPQGWKDPDSKLKDSRRCERKLNTPGKTGVVGNVKPRPYTRFTEFSTQVFRHMVEGRAALVSDRIIKIPLHKSVLVVESFPRSAWQKLGIAPLPAKKKVSVSDLRDRLERLRSLFPFQLDHKPATHDELQALVAGLAGPAILGGDPTGYIAEGSPPKIEGGVIMEGFIVNPAIREATGVKPQLTTEHRQRISDRGQTKDLMATTQTSRALRRTIGPDPATLERMLYYLKLTREAETRIERVLYRQGKIVGGVYTGRGQEAIGVGAAIQLTDEDVVFPSHRDFSSFVIRGTSLRGIFCNWMGRANGPTRGRENTLHIGSLERGIIPIISPLGDTLPLACGVGIVLKRRGKGNVVLVHFGEGTTSRGDVHEAMNLAAVMRLPVIFICNNNAYAYSTPVERQFAVEDLSVRGPAYGMPAITIDGNDVLEVHATVGQAIDRARKGQGPTFIVCKTFRMTGHSAHDAAEYVPEKLFAEWAKKDPIPRLEKFLLARRLITRQRLKELEEVIQKEIDDAVAFAETSPLPEGPTALEGVYCGPDCWWEKPMS